MALTTDQQANIAYKQALNLATTLISRLDFQEPFTNRLTVAPDQIQTKYNDIPILDVPDPISIQNQVSGNNLTVYDSSKNIVLTASSSGSSGIIQYFHELPLTAVTGIANGFHNPAMSGIITREKGQGYTPIIKDNLGNTIAEGQNDWLIFKDAGLLTFFTGVPNNMPPTISFYKYVGQTGIGASTTIRKKSHLITNTGQTTFSAETTISIICYVAVEGIVQEENVDYIVSGNNVTFINPEFESGQTVVIRYFENITQLILAQVDWTDIINLNNRTTLDNLSQNSDNRLLFNNGQVGQYPYTTLPVINSGATIPMYQNNKFVVTLTSDTTIQLTGASNGAEVTVKVLQDNTGGWNLTYPTGITWAGDIEPALTTSANTYDLLFFEVDENNNVFGSYTYFN